MIVGVIIGLLSVNMGLVLFLVLLDYLRDRSYKKLNFPFASFIIPVYNDAESVGSTIKNIFNSYPKGKFEVIAINDKSTDDSLTVLESLKEEFPELIIHNNEKNLGKTRSINNSFKKSKGEIIFIIDADIELRRKNINDIIKRFSHKKVGAVSCRYAVKNKGIMAAMQDMEYSMYGLVVGSYNIFSALNLWGGCMAVKRDVFEKAGMLSQNRLTEDLDFAFKANKLGYRVEQSMYPVFTYAPTDFKTWYKQKLRWYTGNAQVYYNYITIWLKDPISIIYGVLFFLVTVIFLGSIFIFNPFYHKLISSNILYLAFCLPYAWMIIRKPSENYKWLLIIPFMVIYIPIVALMIIIGTINYLRNIKALESGRRVW